ncbi:MAG TPA: hypothetical protein VGC80_11195, partial [Acetobacteraceae bacterium]
MSITRRGLGRTAAGSAALAATPALAANATPIFAVPATTIPIVGTEQVFPVRRIYCIGRNYAAHAREM